MSTDTNKEEFRSYYQAGKTALERGNYRLSIEKLEKAVELIGYASRLGGEAQIWLVTAYQAEGRTESAIALCQELTTHPHLNIRKKAQDVLYIIKAPQLQRPQEWMSEIPDLTSQDSTQPQYIASQKKKVKKIDEDILNSSVDLSQVNTQDNQFITIALILILLIIGSLVLFH